MTVGNGIAVGGKRPASNSGVLSVVGIAIGEALGTVGGGRRQWVVSSCRKRQPQGRIEQCQVAGLERWLSRLRLATDCLVSGTALISLVFSS